MLRKSLVLGAILMISTLASGEGVSNDHADGLPDGLELYLEARVLESNGRYREAMEAYAAAVEEAPEVNEIRLAFATFLVDVGMAEKAVEVLDGAPDPGPEGNRIVALALAQLSSRNPALLTKTEAALRLAIEGNEGDPSLLFSLAQVLQRQGKFTEAEEIVAGLRQGRPGNPRLETLHGDLLRATGRSEEAVVLYASCTDGGPFAQTCQEKLVEVLVELGRPGEAGELMLDWLDDIDLDSLMRAAVLLWEGGRLELSLETVQRVLARAPDSARAQTLEAHLLSSLGRFDEATTRLRRLLKKNPRDFDLMMAMAWSLSRTGDQEKGREWLDQAWELVKDRPDSPEAVRCVTTAARLELISDNPLVAREWLDRAADVGKIGPDYVRLLAETFRRDEQWQEGIAALVRLQPSLAGRALTEAEAMEAEFRLRLGDPRAWRRLRPLLDDDGLENVMTGLQVLQSLERWQEVDKETAVAIDRFGENRDLIFTRAAALERLDQVEESEALFKQLVDTEPNDANAANYLGYMWADREVRLEEALELITRAVSLDPENSAYLDSLGWVHFRLGDLAEAERWLRRAVDLGGSLGDGTIFCHLGEVLLEGGDRTEARRYLVLGLDMGCENADHVRSLLDRTNDEQRESNR
ncbi:MAG: tetratricopeptide repeat protein [Acidobacteria bacterium]|uniref:Tetratricopeptide repeat protein n=1 Tax=Candidatus Sulfomarinibacter kjeldsenii TaxID=2885994 RepID=A0A8J6Y4P3_9BACT|nr:tetratricopeptide repeat protein [Candidatus Sulfomarinibacter kjeldsenii]MBD3857772.1 tetratricopeptide repeat protein [Candidatus Sulfomarinibacter kjeldsenii]MBD3870112.1 tetratricopeptide repeat protein [Candidatus Sulfomarinibacter kjeldsenii]